MGNTFQEVVLFLSSDVCLAAGSFLIHLPTNGILIFSIITFAGSHFSHHAVSQLFTGFDQSDFIGLVLQVGIQGAVQIGAGH